MRQETREAQLLLFRCGKCPILLATDVAARGVHINNVDYVINYDFPGSLEQVGSAAIPEDVRAPRLTAAVANPCRSS